jgi:hypothetical protein
MQQLIARSNVRPAKDPLFPNLRKRPNVDDLRQMNHQNIKMLLSFDDDRVEELISYNELCDIVAEQHDAEANGEQDIFAFREILDHRYVKPHDHDYKGSSINVLVAWEDGTETWEPLTLVAKSDPVTLAVYAKEHDLLDQPGWKRFQKIATRESIETYGECKQTEAEL